MTTAAEATAAIAVVSAFVSEHPDVVTPPVVTPPVVTPPPPPPPAPTPVPGVDTPMPLMPDVPAAPTLKHSAVTVTATGLDVDFNKVEFTGSYICIDDKDPTLVLNSLVLQDITCDAQAGTLFYSHGGCGGKGAQIGRVISKTNRSGRQFFEFCGPWGPIEITDLTVIYDPTPNTMTGNIATSCQLGNKGPTDHFPSVIVRKNRVENIYCGPKPADLTQGWQPKDYWNGDGFTAERSCDYLQVDNGYYKNITDGGIDSKARKNKFGTIYAENCRQALKIWDDSTCDHLTSVNPVVQGGIGSCSHLRFMGNAPNPDGTHTRIPEHYYPDVKATGNAPLIHIEDGPVKFVGSGTFSGPSLVVLANGGSLTADSTWNGKPIK